MEVSQVYLNFLFLLLQFKRLGFYHQPTTWVLNFKYWIFTVKIGFVSSAVTGWPTTSLMVSFSLVDFISPHIQPDSDLDKYLSVNFPFFLRVQSDTDPKNGICFRNVPQFSPQSHFDFGFQSYFDRGISSSLSWFSGVWINWFVLSFMAIWIRLTLWISSQSG